MKPQQKIPARPQFVAASDQSASLLVRQLCNDPAATAIRGILSAMEPIIGHRLTIDSSLYSRIQNPVIAEARMPHAITLIAVAVVMVSPRPDQPQAS